MREGKEGKGRKKRQREGKREGFDGKEKIIREKLKKSSCKASISSPLFDWEENKVEKGSKGKR